MELPMMVSMFALSLQYHAENSIVSWAHTYAQVANESHWGLRMEIPRAWMGGLPLFTLPVTLMKWVCLATWKEMK